MADKRIHELTDEQVSYDPDIVLAVDDSTFTNTKKMPIDAIYALTNTLDATGDYNPITTLLRTNNGSGQENKITVEDFINDSDTVALQKTALNLDTAVISFTGTPGTGVTVTELEGERRDKVQTITGRITVSPGTPPVSTETLIRTIADYDSPGHNHYFSFDPETNVNESASGRIDTSGNIYITAFKESIWRFGTTVIGL
jgi:hypothetical protein